jgi:hypothetical protein
VNRDINAELLSDAGTCMQGNRRQSLQAMLLIMHVPAAAAAAASVSPALLLPSPHVNF